jgi:uncharacterized protein YuzE
MNLKYDADADALYIKLNERPIFDTEAAAPGCMVDFSEDHQVMGIEILRVSEQIAGMQLPVPIQKVRAGSASRSSRKKQGFSAPGAR